MKKTVLIVSGCLFLALGCAGLFLPILPTTPFLLLTAACFLRSSKKLHTWLMGHKFFGPYINGYLKYRAIPGKTKVILLASLWLCILISVFFFAPYGWLKILLIVIALGVSLHILLMKTLTKEMLSEGERAAPVPENPAGR